MAHASTMPVPESGEPTFTERCEYKLEIIPPNFIIQCRRADIVEKNGVEIGRQYQRHCVCPGDDVSEECAEVKSVANALWTTEVINSYQRAIETAEEN